MTKHQILLGTHSKVIHAVQFDDEARTLVKTHSLDFVKDPSWLQRHPTQTDIIYANGHVDGKVFCLKVDAEGKLEILDEADTLGAGPTSMGVLADGTGLAIAHYGSGSLSLIPLSPSGRFTAKSPTPNQTLKLPYPNPFSHFRQESSHAHQIIIREQEVLVPDLGSNVVWRMGYSSAEGEEGGWSILGKIDGLEEGDGPRHAVVHPSGKYIYVLNEVSSVLSIHTLPSDNTSSKLVKKLPIYHSSDSSNLQVMTAAEIILLPPSNSTSKESLLICTNRDSPSPKGDAIALYTVSEDGSQVEHTEDGWYWGIGKHIRALDVDPSGRWVVSAGRNSSEVVVLERKGEKLEEVARCGGLEFVVVPVWL